MRVRISLLRIAVFLVIGLAIIIIISLLLLRIINYLSRPSSLDEAKTEGDQLAQFRGKTIAVVVAHPDDTDWYAGATLALLHRNGNRVITIVGTSGEKGGNNTPALGTVREAEQLEAAKILELDEVIFLRHPDRGLKPDDKLLNELREIFAQYQPEILFTFDIDKEGYLYHHSDHRAAAVASQLVAKEFSSFQAFYLFHSRDPDVIVDVSSTTSAKVNALAAHRSQRNPSIRPLNWIFRLVPAQPRAGSNQSYPAIDVSEAEIFRKTVP